MYYNDSMWVMKKYLVSGIGISDGGVGRLMRKLSVQAEADGYTIVARRGAKSINSMLKKNQYLSAMNEVINRLVDRIGFFIKVKFIKDSIVVFVHPQTAGFKNLFKLISKNKLYIYVMDNSFFCIQSYNMDPKTESECLRCLKAPSHALPQCRPFPSEIIKSKNISYLLRLREVSNKVSFLVQNSGQCDLVKAQFGSNTITQIVGLDTGELGLHIQEATKSFPNIASYDLVFHGAPHLAKGLKYFVELSEELKEFSAFIPSTKVQCEQVVQRKITATNITFFECNWESGLEQAVRTANLVVNPSLWSAPIEGALQKSVHFGRRVATVQSEYGYEREFEVSDSFIRLPRDVRLAATLLRERFPSATFPPVLSKNSSGYISAVNVDIFKLVSSNES